MSSESSPTQEPTETARVIAKPPVIYAGFLVLGLVLDRVWPIELPMPASDLRKVLGLAMIAIGAGLALWAFRQFVRAGTNLSTGKPTLAIVTDGIYRFSRNPIYVGLTIFYLGIALATGSPWAFAMLAPALAVMHTGVIFREERYLERRFGAAYLDYKARVRRWF
ncbi:MAG: isoprenylcysteine carboxylmethyltransferase family protein [Alphaproteobacteria bacterium]|nr:isoprenylcysteine carboxylmethyltransferase family protein [Alphaproteobacteria bacterium]